MNYAYASVRSAAMNEYMDCSVKAVTIASGLTYEEVHAAFAKAGRKHRGKTPLRMTEEVAYNFGLNLSLINPPGKTVRTLGRKVDKSKTYLARIRGHIFAVKNGVIEDGNWIKNRCFRITALFEVN